MAELKIKMKAKKWQLFEISRQRCQCEKATGDLAVPVAFAI